MVTRLKRMESIINKLQRPNSSKLSRIDDIAGIRIIVNNINEIYKVSKLLDDLLIDDNFQLKYNKDYVELPKKDGYRSLHKIFTFNYENKSLNFEIQIRTRLQHLWSTTVEIYDLIEYKNLKSGSFNKLKTWEGLFFKRCSKVIEKGSINFLDGEVENLITYYNILEQEVEKNIKLLLLTIKNIKKLHSAYSNYFLNNNEFIELIEIIHNR
ncbi:MAG: RelA/SpoT domain-containing protein [Fusobacterium polymorphum]